MKAEKATQSTAMDAFRAMAKPEGLKFTPLFAEPLSDPDARIRRLESAVQTLRNDLDTVVPSLIRLVAIEKDMKELVGQLQTLVDPNAAAAASTLPPPLPVEQVEIPSEDVVRGTEPVQSETGERTAPTSLVTPEAAPEGMPPEGAASPSFAQQPGDPFAVQQAVKAPAHSPPPAAKVPAVKAAVQTAEVTEKATEVVQWNHVFGNTQPNVTDTPRPPTTVGDVVEVRIGDHADKTRIVLDATTTENITATLDNDGKRLVIDLPQLGWTGKPSWSAEVAALVSGWTYKDGKLYIDLLYPATIKAQQALEGNASSMARVVIDLFSPEVHQSQ